jgi:uncharacterized repeat protein (TIGR01451 family)
MVTSSSSKNRFTQLQSSLGPRVKASLRRAFWASLIGSCLVTTGCNSTGLLPGSMKSHMPLGQPYTQPTQASLGQPPAALAPRPQSKAQLSSPMGSAAPVIPASYLQQQDAGSAGVQPATPIQLAGRRQQAVDQPVVLSENCNTLSDGSCRPAGDTTNSCEPAHQTGLPVQGGCQCGDCQLAARNYDPSEWVCDGGDEDPAAVVKQDWNAAGVGATDTVMYYETLGGQVCVRPSNRTCVYAPRFGSVRQIVGPGSAENALSTNRVHAPQAVTDVLDRNLAGSVALKSRVIGQKQVHMLDRLNDQQQGIRVQSIVPPTPVKTIHAPVVNQDRTVLEESLGRDWAEFLDGRIEVVTLINPEAIQVLLGDQVVALVRDMKQTSEVFLYETPDKCSMRLTKTASHQMATSGDRIRFTIRFENMGSQKLGNAVILDSLSPRLSYVEGSQQCSVEAQFSVEPNEVGSDILRWDIRSAVESQQGGVISFDCLVR